MSLKTQFQQVDIYHLKDIKAGLQQPGQYFTLP